MSSVEAPPPPASRRVYEHVKAQLLDGTYRDGQLLSEGAIADAVGVSRTPVREAFLSLESEGLLELYPKRGALVVPMTGADVADLFDTRLLIESQCLRRALERDHPGVAGAAAELLDVQRERADAEDLVGFMTADRDMHRVWMAASGSRILLTLFDQLRDRQQRIAARVLADHDRRAQQLITEHERIVRGLLVDDAAYAITALEEHIKAARQMA
ncbi:MAG: GntR family transcriptional regulator [Solirubrobacterales bacterium]|jgi:DNA-binding GntR family transcriptional regulator|nr:GntR family transcriptional regulator [Solirubrobacterales bacterium]